LTSLCEGDERKPERKPGQEGVKKTANVHIQLLLRISLCFTVQT
jgi:hypothetical protein